MEMINEALSNPEIREQFAKEMEREEEIDRMTQAERRERVRQNSLLMRASIRRANVQLALYR